MEKEDYIDDNVVTTNKKYMLLAVITLLLALFALYYSYNFNAIVNENLKALSYDQCYSMIFDISGNLKYQTNFT